MPQGPANFGIGTLAPLAPRQKRRDPSRRFSLFAQRETRDHNGHADECSGDAPEKGPEENREQNQERRDGERGAGDARFEVASDQELDEVEAQKYHDGQSPGSELRQREKRRKHGCDQRTDKRNVVEDERNHAPCRRELQTGEEGKDPDHQASQHAHGAADQHVSLELVGDLRARLQDGSRDVLVVEALDVLPSDIDSSRPRAVNTKVMTTNVTRPCSLSPISCTARMSQLALKFSTSRLVTKMPCSSSQSVDWM